MPGRLIPLLVTLLLLTACDAVQWAEEMIEIQSAIQAEIQQKHGLSAEIGWNYTNGVLELVEIQFEETEVEDMTVSELRELSAPIILEHFEQVPQLIVLQVGLNDVKSRRTRRL